MFVKFKNHICLTIFNPEKMKNLLLLISGFLLMAACNTSKEKLIWSEEFEYNGLPDSTKWSHEEGYIANNEKQYYTKRKIENSVVSDGMLNIIARKEQIDSFEYSSARINTLGKFSFMYGRAEARMKLPVGQGIWPAFWMMGDDINSVGWPRCGETDIMEHINSELTLYGTAHWFRDRHVSSGGKTQCDVREFHNYAVEWDADSLRWLLDGKRYYALNIKDSINSSEEFHKPFFIILNLAIGGDWPGDPDSTTVFPDTVFVDYVRVFRKLK
jgi:beta-glucanase (GH16 family)